MLLTFSRLIVLLCAFFAEYCYAQKPAGDLYGEQLIHEPAYEREPIEKQPLPGGRWYRDTQAIMGTEVSIELWHKNTVHAEQAIKAVMAEMRRIDGWLGYGRTSEVTHLNQLAGSQAVKVTSELFQLIKRAIYYSEISDGAFDITFAGAGKHYDYRLGVLPNETTLVASLAAINYRHLQLNEALLTIGYAHPGVNIDLGGIAKGYAVDNAIAMLKQRGITSAIVSAGGDSRMIGDKQGKPWIVGIRSPRAAAATAQVPIAIPLSDTAISTSGDYERYFERDGVRYHHIINPKTGDSARQLQSVSIIGDKAIDTDALSTTVFVLGLEKGMALINQLKEYDAVAIDAKGNIFYSDGLAKP